MHRHTTVHSRPDVGSTLLWADKEREGDFERLGALQGTLRGSGLTLHLQRPIHAVYTASAARTRMRPCGGHLSILAHGSRREI